MTDRDDTFVSRWARRKRESQTDEERKTATASPAEQAGVTAGGETVAVEGGELEAGDPEVVAKLPDIESLDESSDFSPFLAKGVPEMLRRRALRKLWRLNPVFANLDGLNDYDEDFTDASALLSEVKTIYKVGKGMVSKDDKPEAPPDEAEGAMAGAESAEDRESGGDGAVADAIGAEEVETPATANRAELPPSADAPAAADLMESSAADPVDNSDSAPASATEESDKRKPEDPSKPSAAVRRWGRPSG